MSGTWSAREPGRSEQSWFDTVAWSRLPAVDMGALTERWKRLLVVSAHPDDETLGAGAFVAQAAASGLPIDTVLVTDGEAAYPSADARAKAVLAEWRGREYDAALAALGVGGAVHRLGLPDGGVAPARAALAERLAPLVDESTLVLAPWSQDGHIDHDTTGVVAAQVARAASASCIHYPVWLWHWATPDTLDWDRVVLAVPDARSLHRKQDAIGVYRSQTNGLTGVAAAPEVLDGGVMAHFARLTEVLVDPDGVLAHAASEGITPSTSFDAMFAQSDDPWNVESSWYERRRSALVAAVLPNERLGRVLDIGCSTGALTAQLAERAESVLALDISDEALARARRRSVTNVEWRRAQVPRDLGGIDTGYDLVVLSEIGYFLDGRAIAELIGQVDRLLAPGGVVLAANWLASTQEIPLDGTLVDAQLRAVWPVVAEYRDSDVSIVVHQPQERV